MKEFRCADIGLFPDCTFAARAETEEEVMTDAGRHAFEAHGMAEQDMTPDAVQAVRGKIRDV